MQNNPANFRRHSLLPLTPTLIDTTPKVEVATQVRVGTGWRVVRKQNHPLSLSRVTVRRRNLSTPFSPLPPLKTRRSPFTFVLQEWVFTSFQPAAWDGTAWIAKRWNFWRQFLSFLQVQGYQYTATWEQNSVTEEKGYICEKRYSFDTHKRSKKSLYQLPGICFKIRRIHQETDICEEIGKILTLWESYWRGNSVEVFPPFSLSLSLFNLQLLWGGRNFGASFVLQNLFFFAIRRGRRRRRSITEETAKRNRIVQHVNPCTAIANKAAKWRFLGGRQTLFLSNTLNAPKMQCRNATKILH